MRIILSHRIGVPSVVESTGFSELAGSVELPDYMSLKSFRILGSTFDAIMARLSASVSALHLKVRRLGHLNFALPRVWA